MKMNKWFPAIFILLLLCPQPGFGAAPLTTEPLDREPAVMDQSPATEPAAPRYPVSSDDSSPEPGIESRLAASRSSANRSEFPKQPMTIDEAIDYGLHHNRTMLAAKQEVLASEQRVKQARADFLPKVDSSYTYKTLNEQPYAAIGPNKVPLAHSTTNRWEIDVVQPIFTGFGLMAQWSIARMDTIIASYRLEETRLNVVRDIEHAFWKALLAERLLQVAKDSVKSLEVHRTNAKASFEQGFVAQNDVLKADVALSQTKQRERAAAKQVVMSRAHLNQLLDLENDVRLELSEGPLEPGAVPKIDELYAAATEQRPEYLALKTAILQTDEGKRAARSRYYPRVSAFAQYYREGEDFAANRNDYTNNENSAIGIRVDWNLFEGGKTHAASAEWTYRKKALEDRLRDLWHQVRLQVEDAYEQLLVARVDIDTAGTALKQAEENERMTSLQYQEQMVIFLEVLNAQLFVAQTRADYYQALYGYQIARADLQRAIGEGRVNGAKAGE